MANPVDGTIVFKGKRPNLKNSNSMEYRFPIDGALLSYLKSKDFVINIVSGDSIPSISKPRQLLSKRKKIGPKLVLRRMMSQIPPWMWKTPL